MKLRLIGDTLSVIPVIENLKAKAPDTAVDVMVNKGTEEVLVYNPGIRKLWAYDRKRAKRSILSSLEYHKNLIKALRSERYDFVIDFTLGDRAAFIARMTGAPIRIGYQDATRLSRLVMNHIIDLNPSEHHIVDYQLGSLSLLGLNSFDRNLKLYIPELILRKTHDLLAASAIHDNSMKVVIHPGARGTLRQWRPERFAEIARRLKDEYHAAIILVGGRQERDLVNEVERCMGFSASFKSTALSLLELGALLQRCQLFIGNDSAPGHIAAAVNCPTLTLFGPTFPSMWRPLSQVGSVIFKNVPCCGCFQVSCIRPENTCMDLIDVEEVWAEVKNLTSHT